MAPVPSSWYITRSGFWFRSILFEKGSPSPRGPYKYGLPGVSLCNPLVGKYKFLKIREVPWVFRYKYLIWKELKILQNWDCAGLPKEFPKRSSKIPCHVSIYCPSRTLTWLEGLCHSEMCLMTIFEVLPCINSIVEVAASKTSFGFPSYGSTASEVATPTLIVAWDIFSSSDAAREVARLQ